MRRVACLAGFVEVASRMCHASSVCEPQNLSGVIVDPVSIGEQYALEPCQQSHRHGTPTRGIVVKEHDALARGTGSSHPDPMIGGRSLVALQDLQTRLVTVDQRLG